MLSPLSGKEMILIDDPSIIDYKGVKVRVELKCYFCTLSGETFTTTELDEENLQRLENEYIRTGGIEE